MTTRPTHQTHGTQERWVSLHHNEDICNLMSLVIIYLIAYMYALERAAVKKQWVLTLKCEFVTFNFHYRSDFGQLPYVLCRIIFIFCIYSWMFLYSVIIQVFTSDLIQILQLVLWECFKLEKGASWRWPSRCYVVTKCHTVFSVRWESETDR